MTLPNKPGYVVAPRGHLVPSVVPGHPIASNPSANGSTILGASNIGLTHEAMVTAAVVGMTHHNAGSSPPPPLLIQQSPQQPLQQLPAGDSSNGNKASMMDIHSSSGSVSMLHELGDSTKGASSSSSPAVATPTSAKKKSSKTVKSNVDKLLMATKEDLSKTLTEIDWKYSELRDRVRQCRVISRKDSNQSDPHFEQRFFVLSSDVLDRIVATTVPLLEHLPQPNSTAFDAMKSESQRPDSEMLVSGSTSGDSSDPSMNSSSSLLFSADKQEQHRNGSPSGTAPSSTTDTATSSTISRPVLAQEFITFVENNKQHLADLMANPVNFQINSGLETSNGPGFNDLTSFCIWIKNHPMQMMMRNVIDNIIDRTTSAPLSEPEDDAHSVSSSSDLLQDPMVVDSPREKPPAASASTTPTAVASAPADTTEGTSKQAASASMSGASAESQNNSSTTTTTAPSQSSSSSSSATATAKPEAKTTGTDLNISLIEMTPQELLYVFTGKSEPANPESKEEISQFLERFEQLQTHYREEASYIKKARDSWLDRYKEHLAIHNEIRFVSKKEYDNTLLRVSKKFDDLILQHRDKYVSQIFSLQESVLMRPKKRGNLPKHATNALKTFLFQHFLHPYPTEDEKRELSGQTGLSITQINNWFINARVRTWRPMLESMLEGEKEKAKSGTLPSAALAAHAAIQAAGGTIPNLSAAAASGDLSQFTINLGHNTSPGRSQGSVPGSEVLMGVSGPSGQSSNFSNMLSSAIPAFTPLPAQQMAGEERAMEDDPESPVSLRPPMSLGMPSSGGQKQQLGFPPNNAQLGMMGLPAHMMDFPGEMGRHAENIGTSLINPINPGQTLQSIQSMQQQLQMQVWQQQQQQQQQQASQGLPRISGTLSLTSNSPTGPSMLQVVTDVDDTEMQQETPQKPNPQR